MAVLPCLATGGTLNACVLQLIGIVDTSSCYMQELLTLEANRLTTPSFQCTPGPSPLKLHLLQAYASRHPDPQFAAYVLGGLSNGFHIGFSRSSPLRSATANHPSAEERPSVISDLLQEEVRLGRLAGPIPHSLVSQVQVSPLGLIPKPHQDKWRAIVDLSAPRSRSVNDGIDPTLCSLQYASVDDAVDIILQLGRGTELVKLDLSNAYRMVPVHPDDQPLLGIQWRGATFIDRALPFGLRSAPKIFNSVADFLAWVLHCEGVSLLIHYLDDFLLFGPPRSTAAAKARSRVETVFNQIGAPLAHHKTEGPSTALTYMYLGIQIDTELLQLSLPQEKVARLRNLLQEWGKKKHCTKKDFESLLQCL